jgi:hypothetical protein
LLEHLPNFTRCNWALSEGSENSGRIFTMAGTQKRTKAPRTPETSVMFGFMLVGLVWIIVFYISQGSLPIPSLEAWNILVGFGIAFIGFLMTTRWR